MHGPRDWCFPGVWNATAGIGVRAGGGGVRWRKPVQRPSAGRHPHGRPRHPRLRRRRAGQGADAPDRPAEHWPRLHDRRTARAVRRSGIRGERIARDARPRQRSGCHRPLPPAPTRQPRADAADHHRLACEQRCRRRPAGSRGARAGDALGRFLRLRPGGGERDRHAGPAGDQQRRPGGDGDHGRAAAGQRGVLRRPGGRTGPAVPAIDSGAPAVPP